MKNLRINKIVLRRAAEMLICCIGLSVLICFLCVSGPMPVGSIQRDVALNIIPFVFLGINIVMLRNCYVAFLGKKQYYTVNLCAYAMFAVVNIGAYIILPVDGYTWLFVITKILRYSRLELVPPLGIMIFHLLLLFSIPLAPIGMSWVHRRAEEKYVGEEMIPPRMDEEKIKAANKALEASADKHFKH